jgi:hypothetical protein
MKLRVKNKRNKKLPVIKLRKNRWIFLKLAEQVGGFILKRVVLFEFFILKNV